MSAIYINNMLRPDGGLVSRFPDLAKLFGINPTMPTVAGTGPNKDGASVYAWSTDVTWAYNPMADFPVTANPFSLANAMFGAIPPPSLIKILMDDTPIETKLDAVLNTAGGTIYGSDLVISAAPYTQIPLDDRALKPALIGYLTTAAPAKPGGFAQGAYAVLDAPQYVYPEQTGSALTLPITYPMYLASALVNPLLKAVSSPYLLGTPTADILTPALKILVNIGYNDVITPDKLNTEPPNGVGYTYAQLIYGAYDRSFYQNTPDKPTPFAWFNNPAVTPEEMAKVPGDAWTAFTDALKAQSEKPGFGILVPNPDVAPEPTPTAGAVSVAAQAVPAAAVSAPVEAAPVSAPVDSDPAPDAQDVDPLADATADDTPAAPVTTAGRGGQSATAATADSDAGDNGGGSRAHRGGRGSA